MDWLRQLVANRQPSVIILGVLVVVLVGSVLIGMASMARSLLGVTVVSSPSPVSAGVASSTVVTPQALVVAATVTPTESIVLTATETTVASPTPVPSDTPAPTDTAVPTVVVSPSPAQAPPTPVVVPTTGPELGTIRAAYGNGAILRTRPSQSAPTEGIIPIGSQVTVLGVVKGEAIDPVEPRWWHIRWHNLQGYVYYKLLTPTSTSVIAGK